MVKNEYRFQSNRYSSVSHSSIQGHVFDTLIPSARLFKEVICLINNIICIQTTCKHIQNHNIYHLTRICILCITTQISITIFVQLIVINYL